MKQPRTKIAKNKDESLLIAVKRGKRIYAKPLKPGLEIRETEKKRESGSKNRNRFEL